MSSQWMGQKGAEPPNAGQVPVVTSILKDFSAEALGELRTWLEQNPPAVTIQSIVGFTQFTLQTAAPVITNETTTSLAETDLATVGPSITGIPDGKYAVFFGAVVKTSTAGNTAVISVAANGAASGADDITYTGSTVPTGIARMVALTLSNGGNNSLKMRYVVDGGTGTFGRRWMYALRYSN